MDQKILIPIDLMIDMDFGLIKLVQDEYRADIFDKNVLDSDDNTIKRLLVRRTNPNPLSILTDNRDIDEYYNQFLDERYMDIYARSRITGIGDFCINLLVFSDFSLHLQYTNENEKMIVEKTINALNSKPVYDIRRDDVVPYDYVSIFVKNIMDLLNYRDLNALSIYVARYAFNFKIDDGKEVFAEDKFGAFFITNELKTLDVYKGISIYDLEEDNGREQSNDS